jgi:hypothetical protein
MAGGEVGEVVGAVVRDLEQTVHLLRAEAVAAMRTHVRYGGVYGASRESAALVATRSNLYPLRRLRQAPDPRDARSA